MAPRGSGPHALGRGEPEAPRRRGELVAGEVGVDGHRGAEHARAGRGARQRAAARGGPARAGGRPLASRWPGPAPRLDPVAGQPARPAAAQTKVHSTPVSRDKKDHIALSDAHNSRGIELADRGWLDEAIKEFQKAIELDPGSAHAHDNLATVYSEKKLFREALQEYLTAHPARAGQRDGALQPRLLPRLPRARHGGRRVPRGDPARSRVPRRPPEPRPQPTPTRASPRRP